MNDSGFEIPLTYRRRQTREVYVGDVGVGGAHPIRVQSMTIADTLDTRATVDEIERLVDVGCEIVRVTVPSIKEAENLNNIKEEMRRRNLRVPLVADIHYTPNAALIAAEYVEKVRINPGNYADKKRFEQREYSDAEYQQALQRIEERFKPLVLKCKALGRAMRIGTNHGSLSDRIMNRYGDTPEGMVESALEFVRICQRYDYHDLVLSMKSSNPQVAIQAYRLLAARMAELDMDYPFHLGVTEAGDGEEGRIKSAVGIGALLEDGIGDTVRVSLTEDSVAEVPVAFELVRKYNERMTRPEDALPPRISTQHRELRLPDPFEYRRRETLACELGVHRLGAGEVPRVELTLFADLERLDDAVAEARRVVNSDENGALRVLNSEGTEAAFRCETLHVRLATEQAVANLPELQARLGPGLPLAAELTPATVGLAGEVARVAARLVCTPDLQENAGDLANVVRAAQAFGRAVEWKLNARFDTEAERFERQLQAALTACQRADYWNALFSLHPEALGESTVFAYRYLAGRLDALGANLPLVLRYATLADWHAVLLDASAQLGSLLCDGIGDAVHLDVPLPPRDLLRLAYNLLQATRVRISKTEFISCPSCGRTLFDLQTTTERIKSRTSHLKGVKIAIMGCIVNGPGEMADADFGYVGAGPGKVNLFVGKECVKRNIPEAIADEELIALIKEHGKWVEPQEASPLEPVEGAIRSTSGG